ncbi:MAG: hypothetical protein LBU89_14925 [Fibromonadaceae bacterium]|jgi:hypothetical protein|nr:hypothetical protein [Fibromonadaceae bacterium]
MNHKYTPVGSEGGDYHIDVMLEECTYEYVHAGTQAVTARSGTASAGVSVNYTKVTTEMTVTVRVNVNGEVSERKITSMGEFTGNSSDWNTVTRSFDLAIRATIARMDRFLNSTIGASSSEH